MQFLSSSGGTLMMCPQPLNKEKLQSELDMQGRWSHRMDDAQHSGGEVW